MKVIDGIVYCDRCGSPCVGYMMSQTDERGRLEYFCKECADKEKAKDGQNR